MELESRCQQNMQQAIETQEGLGIEYDEDVVCDVCRSPEGEDGNEMVFCDKCNVCVHQVFNPKTILIVLRSERCNDNTSGRIHQTFVRIQFLITAIFCFLRVKLGIITNNLLQLG